MSEGVRPTGTYKTLDEQREVLSPAEQRFEKARQTIGLFLGPVVFFIIYFLPLPLERDQQTLAAILGFTIIFLFIGAFIIAQAMVTHGLDRRFAFRILSLRG